MNFNEFEVLRTAINEGTRGFYHSSTIIKYSDNSINIPIDIRDFFLLAMVSGNNLLLKGGTGTGKTSFSNGALNSIFGDKSAFLQIDTSLDITKFLDIDFNKIKSGETLKSSVKETVYITAPAVLIDEYNRAPAQLNNILQGWLTNGTVISSGGATFNVGVPISDGKRYQFKVATINDGRRYSGTFNIDAANRDRFPLELDLDMYKPTEDDRRKLLMRGGFGAITESKQTDLFEELKRLYKKANEIPINDSAIRFGIYLGRLDNCYKSHNGSKTSIDNFSPELCEGCKAIKEDLNICGNVHSPSDRTTLNLFNFAKAFAAYRGYITHKEDVQVELKDLVAIAPFVLSADLIGLDSNWIEKYGNKSSKYASELALKLLIGRYLKSNATIDSFDLKGPATIEDKRVNELALENPWSVDREQIVKLNVSIKEKTKVKL